MSRRPVRRPVTVCAGHLVPLMRDHRFLVKEQYERLITPLRHVARQCGYALAVHGSLARDIDLVAVPWTEDAKSGLELAGQIINAVRLYNDGTAWVEPPVPAEMPHGRLAWSIHLGSGPYIDLSVFPRR